jgi:hypothetical protein
VAVDESTSHRYKKITGGQVMPKQNELSKLVDASTKDFKKSRFSAIKKTATKKRRPRTEEPVLANRIAKPVKPKVIIRRAADNFRLSKTFDATAEKIPLDKTPTP